MKRVGGVCRAEMKWIAGEALECTHCRVIHATAAPSDLPVPPIIHQLKLDAELFEDVESGRKSFEIRFDDRGFRVGDVLHFVEHWNECDLVLGHTARETRKVVTYILRGGRYGLEAGYVAMGIAAPIAIDEGKGDGASPT